ncbi:cytochrome b5-like heme/steroid binding domain-containing protein [Aspergillus stella-maris]|uniref:cytochrome b5-like heme/steroid binding domain-containing protein n=1 Tax=Aspergillus stella-maris TaxID=1810926 RepID=UPI003CCD019B
MAMETEQPATTLPAKVQPEPTDTEQPTTPIPVDVEVKPQANLDTVYVKDDLVLHNKDGDLWLAIDGTVYDLTRFSEEHPGGKKILLGVAGTDASKKYRKYHGDNILQRYAKDYKIGTLKIDAPNKESKGLFSLFRKRK